MRITIYTDGGSRGNPGLAAIGVILTDEKGNMIKEYSEKIGRATNNEAEYEAVTFGLQKAKLIFGGKKAKEIQIEIKTDSELVANQLGGKYKILDRKIEQFFLKIWNLKIDFKEVKFTYIPREKNIEADKLVNKALGSKKTVQGLF